MQSNARLLYSLLTKCDKHFCWYIFAYTVILSINWEVLTFSPYEILLSYRAFLIWLLFSVFKSFWLSLKIMLTVVPDNNFSANSHFDFEALVSAMARTSFSFQSVRKLITSHSDLFPNVDANPAMQIKYISTHFWLIRHYAADTVVCDFRRNSRFVSNFSKARKPEER